MTKKLRKFTKLRYGTTAVASVAAAELCGPLNNLARAKQIGDLQTEVSYSPSPSFVRYVGIDYSGARTPTSSLKGLRVFIADRSSPPMEVHPPPSPRKYWTRRGIAELLVKQLSEQEPSIVGIDHGFSFPIRYFNEHQLPRRYGPHPWASGAGNRRG